MTNFIDLIYCNDTNGSQVLACAPMNAFIKKGDIVFINETKKYYFVTCNTTVAKDSDTYNFITEALGEPKKVTDKYSRQEVGGTENE